MSWDRSARRSHSIKTDNSSFERVEHFKYLGTTLTNKNSIQEEIKSRLNSGNACYHSVQNVFFSSGLLSKNLKVKIYRTIILPVVLYGCETWSLTWREKRRLLVLTNFIVAPCWILKIHSLLNTNKCTIIHCIVFSLKFTSNHLKCSYIFRSSDHCQGAYTVAC
jgi:hypothetical protein